MLRPSKYPFVCNVCGKTGNVGDKISWVPGVKGAAHALCSEEGRALTEKVRASHAKDSDRSFPAPEGKSYLPYQRAGIAYALERRCTLIADEMGLGKTIQAIGVINASPEIRNILIICPASLKFNWKNELSAWSCQALSWSKTSWGWTGHGVSRLIYIINYDQLAKLSVPEMWDLVVCDEFQYCKNQKAARTKLTAEHCKSARKILGLTGTPINNRPVELYSLLELLGGCEILSGTGKQRFTRFAWRYCAPKQVWTGKKLVWDFGGADHLEELQEKLRVNCMVRRLKADVLTELPAKRRQIVVLGEESDDGYQITETDYENAVSSLRKGAKYAFEEISEARHLQALRKLDAAIKFIRDSADGNDRKLVVFAHHKDVIAGLRTGLADLGIAVIDGSTSQEERAESVRRFQEDDSCRVFIGSIMAAGTGLTLTAASHVIFVEMDWQPGNMVQAEDRCHRIGQRDSVLVQYLVVDGTLDSKIAKLLVRKLGVISAALDGAMPELPAVHAPVVLDEIAFTSCTCLAAPGAMPWEHATWCDMHGLPYQTGNVAVEKVIETKPKLTPEEIERIHTAVRQLASVCDGAVALDGAGFNALDASFGRSLAQCATLTEKQALAARRMLKKYVRQIGEI